MKIAILTHPLKKNYGGILQAWALQQVLLSEGHSVEMLWRDYPQPVPTVSKRVKRIMVDAAKSIIEHRVYITPDESDYNLVFAENLAFVNKNIRRSPQFYTSHELEEYVSREKFDAIVVGSDQVWRADYSPCLDDFFLGFASHISLRRVAYAASFGLDEWRYTDAETSMASRLIRQFDAVGVREKSGVGLCEKYLGVKAQLTLDPTMLLDAGKYMELLSADGSTQKSDSGLYCYILDENREKAALIARIADGMGLSPFSVMPKLRPSAWRLDKHLDAYGFRSPMQWLRGFSDARMVVTDSFHGMVFSIIFNKPFWVIGNAMRGLARFSSLLSQFGLERRLLTNNSVDSVNLSAPIDWSDVNRRIAALRQASLKFLKEGLL